MLELKKILDEKNTNELEEFKVQINEQCEKDKE